MYNTQKGPTKQNRAIRTPNIIKLTESGVVCIAYSYCYTKFCRRIAILSRMLAQNSPLLSHHDIFHSISVHTVSLSLNSSPSLSFALFLSLSLYPSIAWRALLSAHRIHTCAIRKHARSHQSSAPWYFAMNHLFTGSEHISKYTYENPESDGKTKKEKWNFGRFEFAHSRAFRSTLFAKSLHHSIYTIHAKALSKLCIFHPIIRQTST